jgi:cyanate permease
MSFGRAALITILFAAGASWSGGNVGPVVEPISSEFSVSLTTVGLLSGTVFFASLGPTMILSPPVAERLGITAGMRISCLLCGAGNAVFALSPWFGGLIAGRILAGMGLGFVFILGPVFAREVGGVRLTGLFGGGVSLGIAGALLIGSLLQDAGVDWRVGFGLSALLGIAAFPLIPRRLEGVSPGHEGWDFLPGALRTADFWLLALVFIAVISVPLVLGAWIIQYLIQEGMAHAVAGLLAFGLFFLPMIFRPYGGRLAGRGYSPRLLVAAGCALGAAGVAGLTLDRTSVLAVASVVAMGIGFAIPYPIIYVAGQRVYPDAPVAALSAFLFGANVAPAVIIPLVGAAIEGSDGELVLLLIAAGVLVTGLASTAIRILRPRAPTTP